MKLFSGTRSQILSQHISKKLKIPIGKVEYITFGDSEIKPRILEEITDEQIVIIQSTSYPVNQAYIELFLLIDALRRSGVGKIKVIMPYMGYARQNQQHLPGEPVSQHVMVQILEMLKIDEFITVDIHEEQSGGMFSIPFKNLSALPLLAKAVGNEIMTKQAGTSPAATHNPPPISHNIVVLSPDQGGVERTRLFRDSLSDYIESRLRGNDGTNKLKVDSEIGIVEKKRNLEKIHSVEVVEITGDVKDKIVVIPDDVIVSGGTIVNAAGKAKEKGAKAVYLAATHADFIDGTVEKLANAPVEKVFVTDTIALEKKYLFDKLEVVSVGEMICKEM